MSEKEVMRESDHPFMVKLIRTAQDQHCLYMVLELVQVTALQRLSNGSPTAL